MITNEKLSELRSISQQIKVGVIAIDLLLTVYMLWLVITNDSTRIVGELFGYTPFGLFLLFKANRLFGLCWLHKMMLIHSGAVYLCCTVQLEIGFGETLSTFRWFMFIWGALLALWLFLKRC